MEEFVERWFLQPLYQPLAVLGSYGIGKTTLARRLSYVLAMRALEDTTQRIPIFLRLGEISYERSLEGLLGRALTATAAVHNYTFDAFMTLNSMGRFVIILDGFDEMKHTLTWDEFRFNLRQLNRLVNDNSRVILLGRPTAFLTHEEHAYALHGIRSTHGQTIQEPDWPDYLEVSLATFGREQVEQFLRGYLTYRLTAAEPGKTKRQTDKTIQTLIDQVSSEHLSDIASRPVQLKMLAEVLPQWKGDINNLTLSILYSVFVDLMIEREQEKLARRRFAVNERRQFARDVAWWLWVSKREMAVKAKDIPESILAHYCTDSEDLEAVRRDLVSACFLEKKADGALYFPHRSFQEFLVAETIVGQLSLRNLSIEQVDALITEEIASFMEAIVGVSTLQAWMSSMEGYRGTLSWRFARIWIAEEGHINYLLEKLGDELKHVEERHTKIGSVKKRLKDAKTVKQIDDLLEELKGAERIHVEDPWVPLLLTLAVSKGRCQRLSAEMLTDLLLKKMELTEDELYALLCHLCIVGLSHRLGGATSRSASAAIGSSLASLCSIGRERIWKDESSQKLMREYLTDERIIQFMSKVTIGKRKSGGADAKHTVNLTGTYPLLCALLEKYCLISDWLVGNHGSTIRTSDISLPPKIYTWGLDCFDTVRSFRSNWPIDRGTESALD